MLYTTLTLQCIFEATSLGHQPSIGRRTTWVRMGGGKVGGMVRSDGLQTTHSLVGENYELYSLMLAELGQ